MTIWNRTLSDIHCPLDVRRISNFAPAFFVRNAGAFLLPWLLLVVLVVVRTLVGFTTVYLLSCVISDFTTLSEYEILTWYAPLWMGALTVCECLDYANRRFGEALGSVYGDVVTRRFHVSLLHEPYGFLSLSSRERLLSLVSRYVGHVQGFLHDCEWELITNITRLLVIIVILGIQSPLVLLANATYVVLFLVLAFKLSSRFSKLAETHSQRSVDMEALSLNLFLNAPFLKRWALSDFFLMIQKPNILSRWEVFSRVRRFHATRWFIQLNLFNVMYFCTMLYGILQVKRGVLALGFILLIKWSFDELWKILVYFIEYYVKIVQQAADAQMLREALPKELDVDKEQTVSLAGDWQTLEVIGAHTDFNQPDAPQIEIPSFFISRDEWVGVVGQSGSGKTTLLLILANLLAGHGIRKVNGQEIGRGIVSIGDIGLVTPADPLLKVSLRENLRLGRDVNDDEILKALTAAGVDFALSLDAVIGSDGTQLSTGQEQRIRIARGLLHPGSLLLLDEPFTALDAATKARVRDTVRQYLGNRSVVLVTHDEDDLVLVNRLYRFEGHRLNEVCEKFNR